VKLFCHIQVKPVNKISFSGPLNDQFRKSGYLVFEADNHSDSYLMEQGKQLIDEAETILIHFECTDAESLGQIKSLLEKLRKAKTSFVYQLDGQHDTLDNMLKFLKAGKLENLFTHLSSNSSASK